MIKYIEYFTENPGQIASSTLEHIQLTLLSVALAVLIGVPLGILISYVKQLNKPVLGAANVIQAIPSMALLGFAIPFLGIGTLPAVVMVILYSLLPIVKNTYTGIQSINAQTIEAAKGIGLTRMQVLTKVQIPLALPVIMAGIRISSVTAVGLMTMAAFIGAPGLGELVFSGIRTVNNPQIVAGALPACILALFVDFLVANIERSVSPARKIKAAGSSKKSYRVSKVVGAFAVVLLVVVLIGKAFFGMNQEEKTIVVAGKDFTEQHILVNLVADIIEDRTDIHVERKTSLGGTQIVFTALENGDVDLYVDYSGTIYGDRLAYPPISDVEEVYNTIKTDLKEQFNINALKQMAFNNTYVLAVTEETADEYGLSTISDLAKVGDQLVAGTTYEFLNRDDGLLGIMDTYGFSFKDTVGLDSSPRYIALTNGETDVVDAFSTDGLLKKFDLVTLEDDKSFFPPYYAVPLIRDDTLEKYPELQSIIEELGDKLTEETMIELNYQVDEEAKQPADVARDYLIEQGMISE